MALWYTGEIYDTHIHFWLMDGSQPRLPFLLELRKCHDSGGSVQTLLESKHAVFNRTFGGNVARWFSSFGPEDYLREAQPHKVTAVGFVEAGWLGSKLEECKVAYELHQRHGIPSTILGGTNLADPNCAEELEQMKKIPIFRGIRVSIAHTDNPSYMSFAKPHLLADSQFRTGVARLAAMGLILEIWGYSHQISEVICLAQDFPTLTIVLNHCGTPVDINQPEVHRNWEQDISRLAKLPNIMVKVSGFGMRISGARVSTSSTAEEVAQAIGPYILHVIKEFTIPRCLFASNFPVDGSGMDFASLVNGYKQVLSQAKFSPEDQRRFFYTNAMALYNPALPHSSSSL